MKPRHKPLPDLTSLRRNLVKLSGGEQNESTKAVFLFFFGLGWRKKDDISTLVRHR